jgi:uncharacterized protein YdiU (UPF0061 family)
MDAYDPGTVFSSIDHGGRYAYGNQPYIAQWNLARLGGALLPLIDADQEQALAAADPILQSFPARFLVAFERGMHAKLGLADGVGEDEALIDDLLALLQAEHVDFTSFFRSLSRAACGDQSGVPDALHPWLARWRPLLGPDPRAAADAMDRVNPVYIARNHLVEAALASAVAGDLGPFHDLVDVLARPFDERPGLERYAAPAPPDFGDYRTFCGT